MNKNLSFAAYLAAILVFPAIFSCSEPKKNTESVVKEFPPMPDPRAYVCYTTTTPVKMDGLLDDKAWNEVPWTDYFVDIEGSVKPEPRYKTRAKMVWDDKNLYIGAEIEDPHVWANLRQRDTIILYDNDFEVFIDPDGDTQAYYELEINAYGTPWDLLLLKAYRDGGLPVFGWNIAGLEVVTHIDGTVNNPSDTDKGWTAEIKLPLEAMKECAGGLPKAGDKWRIDFSRVEWKTKVENNKYVKEINPATGRSFPEDNWVWSPQGRINMHMPEMWGYLQFSAIEAGKGTEAFVPDPDFNSKWALRMVYYAEEIYYKANNTYSSDLDRIGLKQSDFPQNVPVPVIQATRSAYEAYLPAEAGKPCWTIYQDGKVVKK
jgi:hypothetical protein